MQKSYNTRLHMCLFHTTAYPNLDVLVACEACSERHCNGHIPLIKYLHDRSVDAVRAPRLRSF